MFLVPIQTREVYLNKLMYQSPALIFQGIMFFSFRPQSACVKNPCENNGTCQSGFTDKGYRCLCTAGFRGQNCKKGKPYCIFKTSKTRLSARGALTTTSI